MGRRAALEPQPTLPAFSRAPKRTRSIDIARRQDGYVLLEIVCVLAIIALLAAVILPAIPRATSRARLEGYAVATAALLKADRVAALRERVRVETVVDAESRIIRSGASGRLVQLPADVRVDALLTTRCYDRLAGATIDFFPSGMSCGGVIALTRSGLGYEVRVNWLTGGVDVVPHQPL
jgi:general secretion pathway protein H